MSIDIRYVTNGSMSGYYVRNAIDNTIHIYDHKEDIPENIRHYAKDGEPTYWGPDMARIMGCQNLLYPDFPKPCGHPDFRGQKCIGETCIYAENSDWTKCKYFRMENA